MNSQIDTVATAASGIVGGIAGSKFGHIIADAALPLPSWMQWALGPFGALVGVLLALVWMVKRLNHLEEREESRRQEREVDRKMTQETLISLVKDTNTVAAAATEVMREVKTTVEKFSSHNQPH